VAADHAIVPTGEEPKMPQSAPSPDMRQVRTLVFDVLGTVVDEAGSIRAELSEVFAALGRDSAEADALAASWSEQLEALIGAVVSGQAGWRSNDALRRASLELALEAGQVTGLSQAAVDKLAGVGHRLAPWPDSAQALASLGQSHRLVALSNAGLAQLLDMFSAAGLGWHGIASGELVRAYKPDPAVYGLAIERFALNPDETMMVAAHPWDLAAAARHGLRTAYVARAGEGELGPGDDFDIQAIDLGDLARILSR
jgi:2-haloacid dehalogenase